MEGNQVLHSFFNSYANEDYGFTQSKRSTTVKLDPKVQFSNVSERPAIVAK